MNDVMMLLFISGLAYVVEFCQVKAPPQKNNYIFQFLFIIRMFYTVPVCGTQRDKCGARML